MAGDASAADAPWPGYSVTSFRGSWRTAHALGWIWQCTPFVEFDHYEFCLGRDASSATGVEGTCLSSLDDPGLALLDCGGGALWHPAVTFGLEPETTYRALLRVYDASGTVFSSPIVEHRTRARPASRVVIFSETEDIDRGYWFGELAPAAFSPHAGVRCLAFEAPDDAFYNLQIGGFNLTYPGIDAARFDRAYVELYIDAPRAVSVCPSFFDGVDMAAEFCPPAGYVPVDGRPGYQRVQIPLARMAVRDEQRSLAPEDLARMSSFTIGAEWGAGSILVDEVVVWY